MNIEVKSIRFYIWLVRLLLVKEFPNSAVNLYTEAKQIIIKLAIIVFLLIFG